MYWATEGSATFGEFTVETTSHEIFQDFSQREFSVAKKEVGLVVCRNSFWLFPVEESALLGFWSTCESMGMSLFIQWPWSVFNIHSLKSIVDVMISTSRLSWSWYTWPCAVSFANKYCLLCSKLAKISMLFNSPYKTICEWGVQCSWQRQSYCWGLKRKSEAFRCSVTDVTVYSQMNHFVSSGPSNSSWSSPLPNNRLAW